MAYGPNISHTGTGVPHGPIPDIFFPRTPSYVTPNPRVEGEVNDGVRDQIARTLREFRFTPKGQARSYQKPYPKYFDMIPYPWGFRVPDLAKFMGDDAKTTYEHIGQFLAQVNNVGIVGAHKMLISCTNISSEYIKKTMLLLCLLTYFHDFSVYSILGT
jgi:hypothetical protein